MPLKACRLTLFQSRSASLKDVLRRELPVRVRTALLVLEQIQVSKSYKSLDEPTCLLQRRAEVATRYLNLKMKTLGWLGT